MYTIYKVIFHLDNQEKGKTALNNVKNLLNDTKMGHEEMEVEILANSNGVKFFKKASNKNLKEITNLLERGVNIALCSNTISNIGIEEEELIPGTTIVPAGVGELVRRQAEGWAYVKV